jgi:hypothetical protein
MTLFFEWENENFVSGVLLGIGMIKNGLKMALKY